MSLPEGVILIPDAISEHTADRLVNIVAQDAQHLVRNLRQEPDFPKPVMRIPMIQYGLWWSLQEQKYQPAKLPVPELFLELANELYKKFSPWKLPRVDSSVVNIYEKESDKLVMHFDDAEHPSVLASGSPVLSLSLGNTAWYQLGEVRGDKPSIVGKIKLEHRTALLLGGPSRLRKHGILDLEKTGIGTSLGARISITFRQTTP